MRVFVTGATGFIGSAIVSELLGAGHQVLGLARSEATAASLIAVGAQVCRGDLQDVESLRRGAAESDGVIHAAFDHDFSKFAQNCEADRHAIEAIGDALQGSGRPLIVTSGLPFVPSGIATEDDATPEGSGGSPRTSESTAMSLVARGVRVSVVRMSQAHDRNRQGFATYMLAVARQKGVSAWVGAGLNRWAAVHRLDAALLYRLALEKGSAGAKYHAVTQEGISVRETASAIGLGLNLPVVNLPPEAAADHFGWLAGPVGMDLRASNALTQQRLDWHPKGNPDLMDDLEQACASDK